MKKIKKRAIIIFLTICAISLSVFTGYVYGSESIVTFIAERKWEELPSIFGDDSYRVLKNYFSSSKSISIIASQGNKLTYKAKFTQQGEIGIITFETEKGKYFNLKIKNQIRPLYFVEKFKRYKVRGLRLSVGDARFYFIKGHFYETMPFHSLLIFKGKWLVSIKPNDREEQLTLKRKYKKDFFSKKPNTGIFILHKKDFLKRLPEDGETVVLDKDMQSLYHMYRETYGIHIKQFEEYWFLPFPQETNLVLFKKDKNSFYYYSYNRNSVPDTQLALSENNSIILSYNAYKGLKLYFGTKKKVSQVNLSLFFNPANSHISGTATIRYNTPSTLRELQLSTGLRLVGNLDPESKGLNIFRKRDKYYLLGPESQKISLYFNGQIKPSEENFELFKTREGPAVKDREDDEDSFFFLSRGQNFYPNPGNEFFKTHVTVTLPASLNCLATGNLTEKSDNVENSAIYKFSSVNSKGISLVTGNFKPRETVDAGIPIHFHTPESFKFPKDLDLQEIGQAFRFFSGTFGPLDLSAIDILVRPGKQEGGVSNNGFIVVNVPTPKGQKLANLPLLPPPLDKNISSPILIRNRTEDHILHELAHQWWGGVISWESYHDIWITEGLAHFSVLYYLKKNMPARKFNRLIRKVKRWVFRYSDTGPIIYGTRINLLEKNYESYQSVIYNKSALVFLMLLDVIGEQDFQTRLKSVIDTFKYRSISSMQFIRQFCDKDTMLLDFFKKWVYSRALPVLQLEVVKDAEETDKKEFKRVVLSVKQIEDADRAGDMPFIFPLKLKVTAEKGTSVESVLIKEKEQRFTISRDSTLRTINIHDLATVSPVKEKKQPNPAFHRAHRSRD